MVELGGRVALPGLIEPHMHLWSSVLFDTWADCSPLANATFDAVVDRIRQAAVSAPAGGWVTGNCSIPRCSPGSRD